MSTNQPSLLLQVASQIQLDIPSVPTWYREDYLKNHGIEQQHLNDELIAGRLDHDIQISWQTYHLTRCSMNLINSCEHIEASRLSNAANDNQQPESNNKTA